MYRIFAFAFLILLGVMIAWQGIAALLWFPIGYVVGLFGTAQIVLLPILGLPFAIRLVAKRKMRPVVFSIILRTPAVWFVVLFAAGFVWPAAVEFLANNTALNLGICFGAIAIILSTIAKSCRSDFRADFDKAYGRFYTDSDARDHASLTTQQKRVKAVITVATNLYLHTIPGAEDARVTLEFSLPDSRFRYLMFCLSAALRASAPAMNSNEFTEVLAESLRFLALGAATEFVQDYFDGRVDPADIENKGLLYLQEFLNDWKRYVELEKEEATEEISLLAKIIHSTESSEPAGKADMQRLGSLAFQISLQLPEMHDAFVQLANR